MFSMFRQDLAQLSIFQGLAKEQLAVLEPLLEPAHFSRGELIFAQGQAAISIFILLSGEVEVNFKPYDGPPLTVARIFPGGVFGWSAAMMRKAYTSSARAIQDSQVFRLGGFKLRWLCERQPDMGALLLDRLAGAIAQRLNNTHTEIVNILTQGLDVDGNCLFGDENHAGK